MSGNNEPGRIGIAYMRNARRGECPMLPLSRPTTPEIRMLSIRKSKRDVIDYSEPGNLT